MIGTGERGEWYFLAGREKNEFAHGRSFQAWQCLIEIGDLCDFFGAVCRAP